MFQAYPMWKTTVQVGWWADKGEDRAWRLVQHLPLLAKPGETFYYNATNYLLIQKVLEMYSLRPYKAWVRKEQFLVAGTQRTFLPTPMK